MPRPGARASVQEATRRYLGTMTTQKRKQAPQKPRTSPAQGRISPRVREAIRLRVEEGYKIEHATRAAGLSVAGYYKAMQRPVVQEYAESLKTSFITGIERHKRTLKAQALEVAADLLHNAKSEAVRARMVEFLAAEPGQNPGAQVNLQINTGARGYEYVPPGARVIDITPLPDSASGAEHPQTIEHNGKERGH
jgi:hypothetical protein